MATPTAPANLATNDIIDELWVDAVTVNLVALAVTAWTAITFSGAWVNQGGSFQTCQYRKEGDRVYLRGSAKSGAIGALGVLPAGFRPPANIIGHTDATNAHSRVDIQSDGTIYVQTGTLTGWLSLDGISFSTVA